MEAMTSLRWCTSIGWGNSGPPSCQATEIGPDRALLIGRHPSRSSRALPSATSGTTQETWLTAPGAKRYAAARPGVGRIFNARRPDRFPAAVLLAADDHDVMEGVRLAAERGWRVSVRSGGHSWAAWSLRDDALLIDLARLRDISYCPATGVVAAGPAVPGGLELAPFLARRGRAFPAGHCASVGLGGYLLQGGQGWNGRSRGWACQSVTGLDVVTADGRLVHADAEQHPDLLFRPGGAAR